MKVRGSAQSSNWKIKHSCIYQKNNVNYYSKRPYETCTEDYIDGDTDINELRKELPPTTNVTKIYIY